MINIFIRFINQPYSGTTFEPIRPDLARLQNFLELLQQLHQANSDEIRGDMGGIRQDLMAEVRATVANESDARIRELIGDFDGTEFTAYCIANQSYRDHAGFRARLRNMTFRYMLIQERRARGESDVEEQSEAESDDQPDDEPDDD